MHNHPDKESILITLDQLDQTLEVLTGVVSRLKKDIAQINFSSSSDIKAEETKTTTQAAAAKAAKIDKPNFH